MNTMLGDCNTTHLPLHIACPVPRVEGVEGGGTERKNVEEPLAHYAAVCVCVCVCVIVCQWHSTAHYKTDNQM